MTVPGKSAACGLERVIAAEEPPAGAGPASDREPVTVCPCDVVLGEREKLLRVGGVTVSAAVCVTPLPTAERVTVADAATLLVVTVKVALVCPEAMVTLAGVVATAVLALERLTASPPGPAGLVRVAVPVALLPPMTVEGETDSPHRCFLQMQWSTTLSLPKTPSWPAKACRLLGGSIKAICHYTHLFCPCQS